jgi:transcriptional regulator with XRE-family HTH domain
VKGKLTKGWLLERLGILNAKELERRSGLTEGRLADVKRGRVNLKADELQKIQKVMEGLGI